MFENLRNEAGSGFFEDVEEEQAPVSPKKPEKKKKPEPVKRPRKSFDQITGTTPFQRFVLSVMLFITVCLMGTMFLLITGKIVPSFLY
ncbi:MAG: hypothetical protein RML93_01400 [Anaerolineales bacterium]|nr:hypothetical protein [Anaerolineales bacterium]MCX7608829.1 hypothetical protein [Anaerolineales bacterium]MDW8227309.1 hypothetical protein [Anaerolineales bacterium]MDW8445927.1 hypothetical protein [Anaerolineales bacterium]